MNTNVQDSQKILRIKTSIKEYNKTNKIVKPAIKTTIFHNAFAGDSKGNFCRTIQYIGNEIKQKNCRYFPIRFFLEKNFKCYLNRISPQM